MMHIIMTSSPFPGMDPYLEVHWKTVRPLMLEYICDELNRLVSNEHLQAHVASSGFVSISHESLESNPITIIQVLDRLHKAPGNIREIYLRDRKALKGSGIGLVEIDLLREGTPIIKLLRRHQPCSFQVCVYSGWWPQLQIVYRMPINRRLRRIEIPLRKTEKKHYLDLQLVIDRCYSVGGFGNLIDYRWDPSPALALEDAVWADRLLSERGLR